MTCPRAEVKRQKAGPALAAKSRCRRPSGRWGRMGGWEEVEGMALLFRTLGMWRPECRGQAAIPLPNAPLLGTRAGGEHLDEAALGLRYRLFDGIPPRGAPD